MELMTMELSATQQLYRFGDLVDLESFLAEVLANFDDDLSLRHEPTQTMLPPLFPTFTFAVPA